MNCIQVLVGVREVGALYEAVDKLPVSVIYDALKASILGSSHREGSANVQLVSELWGQSGRIAGH